MVHTVQYGSFIKTGFRCQNLFIYYDYTGTALTGINRRASEVVDFIENLRFPRSSEDRSGLDFSGEGGVEDRLVLDFLQELEGGDYREAAESSFF